MLVYWTSRPLLIMCLDDILLFLCSHTFRAKAETVVDSSVINAKSHNLYFSGALNVPLKKLSWHDMSIVYDNFEQASVRPTQI